MGQRRILFGLAAVVLIALIPSTANARTWTDQDGNQVHGEFVRMHEGQVVLSAGTKTGKYAFHEFCEEDQDYIRELLEGKGQSDLVPPKVSGESGESGGTEPDEEELDWFGDPGDSEADEEADEEVSEPGIERGWTDKNGREMMAQFVGMSGNNVKFLKDGQDVSFPFFDFSIADQNYLKSLLVSQGKESQIPKRQSGSGFSGEGGTPGAYPGSSGGPYPGSSGGSAGFPRPPRISSRPSRPSYGSGGYPDMSPPSHTRPSYTPPSYTPPSYSSPSTPTTPSYTPPSRPSAGGGFGSGPRPGQQRQIQYKCTNCGAVVPASTKLGDSCPSCNRRFTSKEDEFGNRTGVSPVLVGTLIKIGAVLGAIVFLVVLVAKVSGG